MSSSMEVIDMDRRQELSNGILEEALELGEMIILPTDSPRCTPTYQSYDNHLSFVFESRSALTNGVSYESKTFHFGRNGSTKTPTSHSIYRM